MPGHCPVCTHLRPIGALLFILNGLFQFECNVFTKVVNKKSCLKAEKESNKLHLVCYISLRNSFLQTRVLKFHLLLPEFYYFEVAVFLIAFLIFV